jgi:DNA primase small subunit
MMLSKSDLPRLLKKHYSTVDFDIEDIQRREIGATYYDRHHSFNNIDDLREFLIEKGAEAPMCSTALWVTPEAFAGKGNASMTWSKKNWQGADLSFDLDCDHIDGYESMSYKDQIEEMADHTLRLVNTLESEFGAKEIVITFSGRRGFHVRVLDEAYRLLDSKARRSIMHYLMGEKINIREIMRGMDFNSFKGEVKCSMHPWSHGGWAGKLRIATNSIMRELDTVSDPTQRAVNFINKYHTKKITTKQTNELVNRMISPMARQQITKNGDVRAFLGQKATKTFMLNTLDMFFNHAKKVYAIELDTSVTGDVRRLLRMPGGINLKQGYACMVIDKEHLEDMDLLFFSAEMTFGHEEVQVKVNKPVSINGYRDFKLQPGVHTLPMCEAMLVLCQV